MPTSQTELPKTAPAHARGELLELLIRKSVVRGEFTLSSGAKSDLYIDAKLTTLDPQGAVLVGQVGWELVKGALEKRGLRVDSIGGLTMGADAISLTIGMAAYLENPASALQTFTVRKAAKAHGRQKLVEGNFAAGNLVIVVDDVITTGGSTLQAIDAIQAEGGQIAFVIALVDRQEGGRQNIERRGFDVLPIFTREDVIGSPAC